MSLFLDRKGSTFLKRYCLGMSLLETIIVLSLTVALYDVINFAIFKTRQLNLEKDKAVYLVTIKDGISAFLQQQREKPFCDIDSKNPNKNCSSKVIELPLKDVISSLQYNNLSAKYKKITHVLIKIDNLDKDPNIGYLSALVYTEEDPQQTKLDTARINTLVGPTAGQLSETDNDTISNGRHTFSISKKQWDATLTKNLGAASNVLYLPSTLTEMVKKSAAPAKVDITDFTVTEAASAYHCSALHACHWHPVYTSDKIQVEFSKNSTSTDHIKIELISRTKADAGTVFYSATFFNNQTLSILADSAWYNHDITLVLTPYDIDNNPGEKKKFNFDIIEPDTNHFKMPYSIVLKYAMFDIDAHNQKQTRNSLSKLIIPTYLAKKVNSSSDGNTFTYLKPVTVMVTNQWYNDIWASKPFGASNVMLKQNIADTTGKILLPQENDFDKLMADPARYAFKFLNSDVSWKYNITEMDLYWGNTLVRTVRASARLAGTLPNLAELTIDN